MTSTLSMVDPAARDLAQAFAAFDPSVQPLQEYRDALGATFAASVPSVAVPYEERMIPGMPGSPAMRVLIHRPVAPSGEPMPAVFFLHASGFISGAPEMFAAANHDLAQRHNALVVAIQYRLAPETPFPGPLEDAYAGLAWLFEHAEDLGVDPTRVIVMGESAGGGLAAMLTLLARDRGKYALAGQALVYPMLDPRTGTSDAPINNPATGEFVWTVRHNRFAWSALRGPSAIADTWLPYLAPALAADLAALPPTFIAVGALDLFLEEDVDYALRLSRAGVAVEAHVYPGGIHGFDFAPCAVTSQYRADLAAALTRMLAANR